jgi:plasmid maintenance system antidote protein VapI
MTEYIDLDHIGKILQEEFMEPYKLSQCVPLCAIRQKYEIFKNFSKNT